MDSLKQLKKGLQQAEAREKVPSYVMEFRAMIQLVEELELLKFAYEQTPKQWSTAQAPTIEAVSMTMTYLEIKAKNKKLMSERQIINVAKEYLLKQNIHVICLDRLDDSVSSDEEKIRLLIGDTMNIYLKG